MILTNPQALLLLLLLPIFWWLSWRGWSLLATSGRLLSVVLRTAIVGLVAGALAGPTVPLRQDGTSVVFAVDESASMSEEMKREAEQWVQEALKTMGGRDRAAVVTFGRDPQVQRGLSEDRSHTFTTSLPDDSATSIERALRVGRSLLSNAGGRRIILVTDGGENAGDARQEARLAAAEGIEIASALVQPKTVLPEVLLQALETPSNVRDGEDFDLIVTVYSTVKQPATLKLWLDNKGVGQQQVELEPGTTRFTIAQPPLPLGFHAFRLSIEAVQDTQPGNNVAFSTTIVRDRARVLLIEAKDGEGQPVAAALQNSGIDVDVRPPKAIPSVLSGLRDYQSVILFDIPASAMTLDQMKTLEQFVQTLGRGLMAIGGPQAYGLGDYAETPLEAALPVSMDIPPRDDKPSVALLLIIDKSGSMDYGGRDGPNKMAMAREAAILATEELDPTDQIGVLAFDDGNRWVVPFQTIGAGATREAVKAKIQSIQAGGGTEIFPALQTGYVDLRKRTAQLRHIILLTDGKSFTGGDYDSLVERMRQDQITLSTVGIGSDTDEALLKMLASKGKGRYHLTTDAKKIPQIVTKETKIASKNPIVESRFHAQINEVSPILRGFKPEDLPPLKGYVVTTPKPTAQRVLSSPSGDPILSKWQYGLGRAVAWTPDVRQRWAADWLSWQGFPKFVSQAVRWTMPDPANRNLQTSVAVEGEEALITLEAAEDDGSYIDLASTTVAIVAADNSRRQLTLRQIAPGRYEGRIAAGPPGAYRMELGLMRPGGRPPLQDIAGFSVPYPAELRPTPGSPALLYELARLTGGRLMTSPQEAFVATRDSKATHPYPIWPWLLLAAALLLPIEIAARRGILGSLVSRSAWRRIHFGRAG
jgi:Ca-activated chloride channel family protein